MPDQSAELISINPSTGSILSTYEMMAPSEVEAALDAGVVAGHASFRSGTAARCTMLQAVAGLLRSRVDTLADLIALEIGRPLHEGRGEVLKSADCCDYYANIAPAALADIPVPTSTSASFVRLAPYGLVLAVMPWNLPIWQAMRFIAPCVAGGNAVLLKHAPNATGCALAIADIFREAGAVSGLVQALLVDVPTAERVIVDPRVRLVAVTGSDATGARIASLAGGAIKKTIMELGGSDAFIVLADADLPTAAAVAAKSRYFNAGQTCIAAKRILVERSVMAQFEEVFVASTRALVVGDPRAAGTEMGPMARADLQAKLHDQVARSLHAGAQALVTGGALGDTGFFESPTVLTNCAPGMAAFDEELFGPVAAIMPVESADHAVSIANGSVYGLGASIWTADIARGVEIADRLEVGGAFVNAMTHSDVALPFGGTKRSGYGRDLGTFGLAELVSAKTIWRPA